MNIIEVIPISSGISKETLSYFTSEEHLNIGAIIEIPLRNKKIKGIVVGKKDAEAMRSSLRQADFELKKISRLKAQHFFLPEFIQSVEETARYFLGTRGSTLNSIIPKSLLENLDDIKIAKTEKIYEGRHEKFVLQADDEERLANYKSLIREEFAKKSSVFFCLPTIHDVKRFGEILGKGIEEFTYIFHSGIPEENLKKSFVKLGKEVHPVLIVGTGAFLSFPRPDLGAIIIEKQNSQSYKSQSRPFLDFRVFASILSKKLKIKFVVGDIFIDIETLHAEKKGEFQDLVPLKFRNLTGAEVRVVDMRNYKNLEEKKYTVIGDELKELIKENKECSENLYIFTTRKGLAPITVCGDCSTLVTCRTCSSNMVLHGSSKGNFFLCHKCGERRDPGEACSVCGSWKLVTLGAGEEKIEEEIKETFPESKVFVLDKDRAPTVAKALKTVGAFHSSPGSILLGTELALFYLEKVENCAILGIDSLFSIPDYRINEKVMSLIIKLRSLAQKKLILQTRNPERKVLEYGMKGNLLDFYREEIEIRETFRYPPFFILIKVSLEGEKKSIVEKMGELKKMFDEHVDIFPSFIRGKRGKPIMHALLRVPKDSWPDDNIVQKLFSLSPQFIIKVDPESLL